MTFRNPGIRMSRQWTKVFMVLCGIFLIYVLMWDVKSGSTTNKHVSTIKEKIINVVRPIFSSEPVFTKFNRYIPPENDNNCVSSASIPQELLESSKDTAIVIPKKDTLESYNSSVLACLYHRYVQTFQRHCTHPTRVGAFSEGGWNVCTDPEAIPTNPCVVYTFSDDRNYDSFSDDMAKNYKCDVYNYHPKKENKTSENLQHGNLKLGTDDGLSIDTFKKMLNEKSHKTINVLNIDISGREWDVLQSLLKSGILGHTEQLSLRLHSEATTDSSGHIKRLLILRELYDIGFRIYWNDRDIRCILKNFKKVTGCYYINMIRIMNRPSPLIIPKEPEFSKMEPQEYGALYRKYVYSVQIPCKQIVRIGNIRDGGWDVCHDAIFRPQNNCLTYSFGINNDYSFDDDMVNTYECKVFAYDPSMRKPDHQHSKNVMFYATGISNKNGKQGAWKMRTFETMVEETGQKGKIVDYMKMDVESSELVALPQMISSGSMKYIRQFAFEIHSPRIQDDTNAWYKDKLTLFRDLYDIGFRIFWSHRNPACVYRPQKGPQRCFCYEIYFLNTNVYRES